MTRRHQNMLLYRRRKFEPDIDYQFFKVDILSIVQCKKKCGQTNKNVEPLLVLNLKESLYWHLFKQNITVVLFISNMQYFHPSGFIPWTLLVCFILNKSNRQLQNNMSYVDPLHKSTWKVKFERIATLKSIQSKI